MSERRAVNTLSDKGSNVAFYSQFCFRSTNQCISSHESHYSKTMQA